MVFLESAVFIFIFLTAGFILRKRFFEINFAVQSGRNLKAPHRSNYSSIRWNNLLLVAFGQQKMFTRFIPAFFHGWIYVGFLIINLEVFEFLIDGIFGTHRVFAPYLGRAYPVIISFFEFLAVAVLISCLVFLGRRNIVSMKRFRTKEMTTWPTWDANLILIIEIILVIAILSMNAADQVLQTRVDIYPPYPSTGTLFFSQWLMPLVEPLDTVHLIRLERGAWWFHIIGIFSFAIYVTYSKHLHIVAAFFSTYYARQESNHYINNMPVITQEVVAMLTDLPAPIDDDIADTDFRNFGAKDVDDLQRWSLIGAYACTECGRCTDVCPAHITGKKLSPRKIMMDTRDRLRAVEKIALDKHPKLDDGKSLLDDYITREEIQACTTCGACAEACPIMINPLEIIVDLRRYLIMEQSAAPPSWNSMFQSTDVNYTPWAFPHVDRYNWIVDFDKT